MNFNPQTIPPWTPDNILEMARAYQPACILAAAADWDLFTVLAAAPMTADALARRLGADPRATTILLDALVALNLLVKNPAGYRVPPEIAEILTESGSQSVLPMVRHQANCHRRWIQLDQVLRTGAPADRSPSRRGEAADQAAFIAAMNTICQPITAEVLARLQPLRFRHLLDLGGASGTWTIAFLQAVPDARATLFDLPDVIPMARQRLSQAGLLDRVTLVPGDFYQDTLPSGADLVWLSAIAHQNSRPQNRRLFAQIHTALAPHGVLLLRDVVMDESRTHPPAGALFALNMLVNTDAGGTYTFPEYQDDLQQAGFSHVDLLHRDDVWMNSLIRATKTP